MTKRPFQCCENDADCVEPCFQHPDYVPPTPQRRLYIASAVIWALMLVGFLMLMGVLVALA